MDITIYNPMNPKDDGIFLGIYLGIDIHIAMGCNGNLGIIQYYSLEYET